MDVLDLLKADHQQIKHLSARIKNEPDRNRRFRIFKTLKSDLDLHTAVEETIFYPAFQSYPDFKDLIYTSFKDHSEVKVLSLQIEELTATHELFEEKLESLIDTVEDHFQTEESQLFPKVRRVMSRNEREKLGRLVQSAKQEGLAA